MHKISIIVPVYKVEPYLERCIDSLIDQTVHNHEIILVDDGSPDSCPQICDEYAERYDFIRVIHKPNGGVSSARNAGLDTACGEYVWFVDSDDYVENTAVEFLLSQENLDTDLIVFNSKKESNEKSMEFNTFFRKYYVNYYLGFHPWNKLFCRKIIEENNIRFDPQEKIGEDLLFNATFYRHMKSFKLFQNDLYYYNQRDDSAMHTGYRDRLTQQMRLYDKLMSIWYDVLDEDIRCCLFIMHLLAGINQSRRSGVTKKEYLEHLEKQFKKVNFSRDSWNKATSMFLSAEKASFLGGLRVRIFLWLNRHGMHGTYSFKL